MLTDRFDGEKAFSSTLVYVRYPNIKRIKCAVLIMFSFHFSKPILIALILASMSGVSALHILSNGSDSFTVENLHLPPLDLSSWHSRWIVDGRILLMWNIRDQPHWDMKAFYTPVDFNVYKDTAHNVKAHNGNQHHDGTGTSTMEVRNKYTQVLPVTYYSNAIPIDNWAVSTHQLLSTLPPVHKNQTSIIAFQGRVQDSHVKWIEALLKDHFTMDQPTTNIRSYSNINAKVKPDVVPEHISDIKHVTSTVIDSIETPMNSNPTDNDTLHKPEQKDVNHVNETQFAQYSPGYQKYCASTSLTDEWLREASQLLSTTVSSTSMSYSSAEWVELRSKAASIARSRLLGEASSTHLPAAILASMTTYMADNQERNQSPLELIILHYNRLNDIAPTHVFKDVIIPNNANVECSGEARLGVNYAF